MPRWEPRAKERLEAAALDLFEAHGYEQTTIAQIAAAVGVTSRTYFRYFPDKREVLFGGEDALRPHIEAALYEAPTSLSPMAAALDAMSRSEPVFRPRSYVLRRQAIIDSSTELQERESKKHAAIAEAITAGLRRRGVDANEAQLVSELASVVFRTAAHAWMRDVETPFAGLLEQVMVRAQDAMSVAAAAV